MITAIREINCDFNNDDDIENEDNDDSDNEDDNDYDYYENEVVNEHNDVVAPVTSNKLEKLKSSTSSSKNDSIIFS